MNDIDVAMGAHLPTDEPATPPKLKACVKDAPVDQNGLDTLNRIGKILEQRHLLQIDVDCPPDSICVSMPLAPAYIPSGLIDGNFTGKPGEVLYPQFNPHTHVITQEEGEQFACQMPHLWNEPLWDDRRCEGECSGTGVVSIKDGKALDHLTAVNAAYYTRGWHALQSQSEEADGWQLVPCRDCGGSGFVQTEEKLQGLLATIEAAFAPVEEPEEEDVRDLISDEEMTLPQAPGKAPRVVVSLFQRFKWMGYEFKVTRIKENWMYAELVGLAGKKRQAISVGQTMPLGGVIFRVRELENKAITFVGCGFTASVAREMKKLAKKYPQLLAT